MLCNPIMNRSIKWSLYAARTIKGKKKGGELSSGALFSATKPLSADVNFFRR